MSQWRMAGCLEGQGEVDVSFAIGPYEAPSRVAAFHLGLNLLCDRVGHDLVEEALVRVDLFREEEFHDVGD